MALNAGRSGSSTGAQPSSIANSSPSSRAAQSSASGRWSVPSTAGSRAMRPCCGIRRGPRLGAHRAVENGPRRRVRTDEWRAEPQSTPPVSPRRPSARRAVPRAPRAPCRPHSGRPAASAAASSASSFAIASCNWPSMPSDRAFFSGSSRCQRSSSSERTCVSTLRRRSSTGRTWSRGTRPISSQLRWMRLSAARACLGSVTVRSFSASSSSASFSVRFARYASSSCASTSAFAWNSTSPAALNFAHRASSSFLPARPACFHSSRRAR